ncbi:MAG: DNA repair ATPase [Acidobacteriota bacterium]|nr:DNA repair ATPase [Acidobacteriota bacterium]
MAEDPTRSDTTEGEGGSGGEGASLDRGTYELIRERLDKQAAVLGEKTEALNQQRIELFGGQEMAVVGSVRIRTENNCVPRDLAQVGDRLLFGYNVFIGLRKETAVSDVFSCHRFEETGDGTFAFTPVAADFLEDPRFVSDFQELYTYYKDVRLLQLRNAEGRILAVFQTGATAHDIKVLRWQVDPDGNASYLDNRGERDHAFGPSHDFQWTLTTREQHVQGQHAHVDILGKVFVETIGGDLTVKVEDNTEDGLGVYREPVEDKDQALDDGEIAYAEVGSLILLRILPYREDQHRYLVFNTLTQDVRRIDAIGWACQQLPEDHGIIFPGGYYLQSGECKEFADSAQDLEFLRRIRSPNGEDALYVFHQRENGHFLLLPYNLIRKRVQTPIHCHGYSLFPNGRLVLFRSVSDEPTRVHTMQIWQTPFESDEHAASQRRDQASSYLEQIGNADLVRGISDLLAIQRAAQQQEPTAGVYEELLRSCRRALDHYHWLDHEEVGGLQGAVAQVRATAEQILDEFEKVRELRAGSSAALDEARTEAESLIRSVDPARWESAAEPVEALRKLRRQRGHLISLRERRYLDRESLDELEGRVAESFQRVARAAVDFLGGEEALAPYHRRLDELEGEVAELDRGSDVAAVEEEITALDEGLRVLAEVTGTLEIDDAAARADLLERISEVLAGANRVRALLEVRRKELRGKEARLEFGAEFKLFAQSVSSALSLAGTPEQCDEALTRLLLQLEEIESRYADFDEFLDQLVTQREEVTEAFSAKKQQLLEQRQLRAQRLAEASQRILGSLERRAESFDNDDDLNAFFASDPMLLKLRDLTGKLREAGAEVKAEEIEGAIKAARQEAARSLRDRREIFEEGNLVRLGRHRFSVNTQPLGLTLISRDGGSDGGSKGSRLFLHLTGTDFFEPVQDAALDGTEELWSQSLVSETEELYRGEYLACSILRAAEQGRNGLDLDQLHDALETDRLLQVVRRVAAERYDEGYERGVHDHDAARILGHLVSAVTTAGLLRYRGDARALAVLYFAQIAERGERERLQRRCSSVVRLQAELGHRAATAELEAELARRIEAFAAGGDGESLPLASTADPRQSAAYLVRQLGQEHTVFEVSGEAEDLEGDLQSYLRSHGLDRSFEDDLRQLESLEHRLELARLWLDGYLARQADKTSEEGRSDEASEPSPIAEEHRIAEDRRWARDEVAAWLALGDGGGARLERKTHRPLLAVELDGMLGQHPRIRGGVLRLRVDGLLARYERFRSRRVPAFRAYQKLRHEVLERARRRLRIDELEPKVMSTFVRNRLLDEVYLPLIGDNLAKQIGAAGDEKRTDLMGLLLLISPPGYGKTTLMEYIAHRLGLVFVKVNGPALGHGVTSFDPQEAPNATARQEVEKINFAFEMGNNVLLYLDDIQHTSSELLQKFISLCDAQRRVEGVWRDHTRTYDLRGKRFAVCMAGNPYTESGERFQIPDMLANRSDVYNLGDVLSGKDRLFALSYIENALTSNPVLAPLAGRPREDLYLLVRRAQGEEVPTDQLQHPYSAAELSEVLAVLEKLLRVQQVLLAVNRQYIASAAQDDRYRTEPRFQLQGSYRNMAKLAERVVAVMDREELEALLDDHYRGEAQTLTTGAEHNLLKLRELRGVLTPEEQERWQEILRGFARAQAMGGDEDDPITRVTGTLGLLSERLSEIGREIQGAARAAVERAAVERSTVERAAAAGEARAALAAPEAPRVELDLDPYIERLQKVVESLAASEVEQRAQLQKETPRQPAAPAAEVTSAFDPEQLAGIRAQLEQLASGLGLIAHAVDKAVQDGIGRVASTSDIAPAGSGTTVQVVQTLQSGVHDILEELTTSVDQGLMELVRSIHRWMKRHELPADKRIESLLDGTLEHLDRLKDLAAALRRLDTQGLMGKGEPAEPGDPS